MRGRPSKAKELNRELLEMEADLQDIETDIFEDEPDDTEELYLGGNWEAAEEFYDE